MTNLFFSKNKVLYTPIIKKSGINGIMRQVVIDNAKLFFKEVREIEIKRKLFQLSMRCLLQIQ